jgi:uncharacterized protein YutD
MSYYSQFSYDLNKAIANTKKVKKLEEFFEDNGNYGFAQVKIRLENPDDIESEIHSIYVNDSFTSFYDDEEFAERLSKVLVSGFVILEFCGEDGNVWGYRISRNKVQLLTADPATLQWVESEQLNF